ncbi:MAG: hypothetical protein AB7O97_10550 [Planctomycetota bacterium]
MRALLVAAIACGIASAQTPSTVVFVQSVGTPQTVPDPAGGATGIAALQGIFGPAVISPPVPAFLRFTLNGLPGGYNSGPTGELMLFTVDIGVPATTATILLGGTLFLPNPATAPVTTLVMANPSSACGFLGPLDTVPIGGTSGGIQDPVNNGARFDASSLFVPAAIGVDLTIQGALLDPNINTLFTSNALHFQVQ